MNAVAPWWTFPFFQHVRQLKDLFGRTVSKQNDPDSRSDNQSNSTLCVLVTCLKFGLRPLLIIWITAFENVTFGWVEAARNVGRNVVKGLKNTQLSDCEWDGLTLWRLERSWVPLSDLLDNVSHTSQNSTACKPSIREPASNKIISDSALHLNGEWTNVCDATTHSNQPGVDFESRKSPAAEASWKN